MFNCETLEAYRQMTPGQRLALTLQAMRDALPCLLQGPREVVQRRFEWVQRENTLRNRHLLEALARAQGRP